MHGGPIRIVTTSDFYSISDETWPGWLSDVPKRLLLYMELWTHKVLLETTRLRSTIIQMCSEFEGGIGLGEPRNCR
jgi:hypothetical protein